MRGKVGLEKHLEVHNLTHKVLVYTVEFRNKGHFGSGSLSFLWRLSLSQRFTVFCHLYNV